MAKIIKINVCAECPNYDHKGAFGQVAYIPVCRLAKAELPWIPHTSIGGRVQAVSTGLIPEWCPLEDYNAPSN